MRFNTRKKEKDVSPKKETALAYSSGVCKSKKRDLQYMNVVRKRKMGIANTRQGNHVDKMEDRRKIVQCYPVAHMTLVKCCAVID